MRKCLFSIRRYVNTMPSFIISWVVLRNSIFFCENQSMNFLLLTLKRIIIHGHSRNKIKYPENDIKYG
jgi:hypothetical protein